MLQFIGIIPARYASTRFPGKALAEIGGKAMIQRVFEQAKLVFDDVVVATDDDRIRQKVEAFGGRAMMTSDKHLSGTDRCAEAYSLLCRDHAKVWDVVVNIQGDEPFIQTSQLELLKSCFDDELTDIATLVKPIESKEELMNPNLPKVALSHNMRAVYFSRSPIPYLRGVNMEQWTEKAVFYRHIGLYAYRSKILKLLAGMEPGRLEMAESLEQLRWLEHGLSIKTAITTAESYGIDTPEDLERINRIMLG